MAVFLLVAVASYVACQQLPLINLSSVAGAGAGMCPDTQDLREAIEQNILSALRTRLGYGACGCGGPGWRRAAYLNMSDPTQTCPPDLVAKIIIVELLIAYFNDIMSSSYIIISTQTKN